MRREIAFIGAMEAAESVLKPIRDALDVYLGPFVASLDPLLVWGLFYRILGFIYFLAFASMTRTLLPLAGSRGVTPIRDILSKARSDFRSWRRFLYFPTLLWISTADWFMRLLHLTG